jgi:hypothetical protein
MPSSIADYPEPFNLDEGLGSTTIVFEKDDPQSWKVAAALAFDLGAEIQSRTYNLFVRFPNGFNFESSKAQQFLIIGLTNKIPFSTKINNLLPAPFKPDGSLQDENKLKITYGVKKDQPLGYLELVNISTSPQSQALLVLGANAEGLAKAGQTLLDAAMRERMQNSNFVLIQDEKLLPEFIETHTLLHSQTVVNEPEKTALSIAANLKQWTWVGLIGILVVLVLLIGTSILKSFNDKKIQKTKIPSHQKNQGNVPIKRSKKG